MKGPVAVLQRAGVVPPTHQLNRQPASPVRVNEAAVSLLGLLWQPTEHSGPPSPRHGAQHHMHTPWGLRWPGRRRTGDRGPATPSFSRPGNNQVWLSRCAILGSPVAADSCVMFPRLHCPLSPPLRPNLWYYLNLHPQLWQIGI